MASRIVVTLSSDAGVGLVRSFTVEFSQDSQDELDGLIEREDATDCYEAMRALFLATNTPSVQVGKDDVMALVKHSHKVEESNTQR